MSALYWLTITTGVSSNFCVILILWCRIRATIHFILKQEDLGWDKKQNWSLWLNANNNFTKNAYNSVQNVLAFRLEPTYLKELFETYRSRSYINEITQLKNLECYMTKKAMVLYIYISTVTELTERQFNGLSILLWCVDKKYVNDEFRAEL
jgi:hypothetical protein